MKNVIIEKGLDTANKTLDLVDKVYDDGLKKPVKVICDGISVCLEFIGATVSPAIYKYVQNAEYKKQEIDFKLKQKYEMIPEEKRIEPRMSVLGPAVDLLKYNLDEEHIKEIFINLLSNEMNKDKQDTVLPSYVEIVKQLSSVDAKYLKSIYEAYRNNNTTSFALDIIRLKPNLSPNSYINVDKVIVVFGKINDDGTTSVHTITPKQIVLDNLSRLEIIKIHERVAIAESELYELGFNTVKRHYENPMAEVIYEKGVLELTDYGRTFLSVCFEENN